LTNTPGRNCLSANVFVTEGVRGVWDGLFLSDTSQIIAVRYKRVAFLATLGNGRQQIVFGCCGI